MCTNYVTKNEIKNLMTEYSYVTRRSSIENIEKINNNTHVGIEYKFTTSKWGSQTEMFVTYLKNENNNDFDVIVEIIGETISKRLQKYQSLFEKIDYATDHEHVQVIGTHFTNAELKKWFRYNYNDVKIMEKIEDIMENIVPENSYHEKTSGRDFIVYPHQCQNCGKEVPGQCWYKDVDGIYKDYHFHITNDDDIKVVGINAFFKKGRIEF